MKKLITIMFTVCVATFATDSAQAIDYVNQIIQMGIYQGHTSNEKKHVLKSENGGIRFNKGQLSYFIDAQTAADIIWHWQNTRLGDNVYAILAAQNSPAKEDRVVLLANTGLSEGKRILFFKETDFDSLKFLNNECDFVLYNSNNFGAPLSEGQVQKSDKYNSFTCFYYPDTPFTRALNAAAQRKQETVRITAKIDEVAAWEITKKTISANQHDVYYDIFGVGDNGVEYKITIHINYISGGIGSKSTLGITVQNVTIAEKRI